MNERLMTVEDCAGYLGLSVSHVYTMVSRRAIPHIKIGHAVRFVREDIDRWLESKSVPTREEIRGAAAVAAIYGVPPVKQREPIAGEGARPAEIHKKLKTYGINQKALRD